MHRCLALAVQAAGNVAPNPMVGAVLVNEGRILAEGYHRQYGQAHAEVNCINALKAEDRALLPASVMYVSLEPCAHFGKTPPCADRIIAENIGNVVIGCRDPFKQVDGRGIEKLKAAGIHVTTGVLEKECQDINKRFFCFHTKQRPYIILKWAQTPTGQIGNADHSRLLISNAASNRLVHQWRSEEAAILVGTNTALYDNPSLTNRYWTGRSPVRLVLDMDLRLPASLHLFNGTVRTIVFNSLKEGKEGQTAFYQVNKQEPLLPQLCNAMYKLNIQSVLVEGGAQLLQSFIDAGLYDEVRIITGTTIATDQGLQAPQLREVQLTRQYELEEDTINIYTPAATNK